LGDLKVWSQENRALNESDFAVFEPSPFGVGCILHGGNGCGKTIKRRSVQKVIHSTIYQILVSSNWIRVLLIVISLVYSVLSRTVRPKRLRVEDLLR
jgi:hypothetical protein